MPTTRRPAATTPVVRNARTKRTVARRTKRAGSRRARFAVRRAKRAGARRAKHTTARRVKRLTIKHATRVALRRAKRVALAPKDTAVQTAQREEQSRTETRRRRPNRYITSDLQAVQR